MPPRLQPRTLPYTGQSPKLETLPDRGQQKWKPKPLKTDATSLGQFAVDLITSLGGRPTPGAKKLFSAWQRWEGGWTNNAAKYNPLNLTAPSSGFPTINSVGVVAMPSYRVGVQRTADLLRSGYPSLARAFKTGQIDFSDPSIQGDLNRWLSGKRTPGMTPYVQKIARAYGQNVPAGAGVPGAPPPRSPLSSPQAPGGAFGPPVFDPELYREQLRNQFLTGGGRMDLMQLPGIQQASFVRQWQATPQAAKQAEGQAPELADPKTPLIRGGKGIQPPTSFKKTHDTSNLGWPAIDIMGKPGTPLRSPVAGVVVRHGGAQGGEAMYIDTNGDGEGDYWAGHITNMVPVGTKLRPGDVFAYISPDHAAPHLHWAKR